jgi:hypothetical protein
VTLKGPKGNVVPLTVGPEVRNLAQVKVGDQVRVRYAEALSLTLKKDGKELRTAKEASEAMRAPAGARPGAAVGEQVTVIADVIAINAKTHEVTLRGPEPDRRPLRRGSRAAQAHQGRRPGRGRVHASRRDHGRAGRGEEVAAARGARLASTSAASAAAVDVDQCSAERMPPSTLRAAAGMARGCRRHRVAGAVTCMRPIPRSFKE